MFVATDHNDVDFFSPLADHYDVVYLSSFKKELEGINIHFYGMIAQLIASRGRVFFGCYQSTFSGFIFRMRGYHAQKQRMQGYENGTLLNSFYYSGLAHKYYYQQYSPIHPPHYVREWSVSWRDIDKGIA